MSRISNDASIASQAFRIFSYTLQGKKEDSSTTFAELGDKATQSDENKSGLTTALNDFARAYVSLGDSPRSNIRLENVNVGFWDKIKRYCALKDNIFASTESIEEISKNGAVFQSDLFESEISLNDGIKYAKENNDLTEAALNFAKADIRAVERVYSDSLSWDIAKNYCSNKKLNTAEMETYADINESWESNDYGTVLDLNGIIHKNEVDAKEYASYILYADSNQDGLITQKEAEVIAQMDNETLQEEVKKVYKENY